VHEWLPAEPLPSLGRRMPVLGDVMTTDLFTLRPDDVVDLASGVMKWKRIRHVPVEDAAGRLVGVLTARELLAIAEAAGNQAGAAEAPAVASLMHTSFTTAPPDMSVQEAVPLMLGSDLGALLVVSEAGTLMGIVTERDMVLLLADLLGMVPAQFRADVACAS
jgi:CBS domain-containing protein